MSKRFGRNQRRRLREEVAATQVVLSMVRDVVRRQRLDLEQLRCVVDDVRHALGESFIGLPPQVVAARASDMGYDKSFRAVLPNGEPATMCAMTIDSNTRPDGHVHMRVRLAGKDVCYALSQRALMDAPANFIARRLASEMAPFLLEEIRKAGGR